MLLSDYITDNFDIGALSTAELRRQLDSLLDAYYKTCEIRGVGQAAAACFANVVLTERYVQNSQRLANSFGGPETDLKSAHFRKACVDGVDQLFDSIVEEMIEKQRGKNV